MSKKLFNPGLPIDYTPKKKTEVACDLTFTACLICQKNITDGYYGRWGSVGTCSKTCEQTQEAKPKHKG